MKPIRIQRSRRKDYKTPENTIYVGRPTKWGNPFEISDTVSREQVVNQYFECVLSNIMTYVYFDELQASINFDRFKWIAENLHTLKGKNLSCWCKLDQPCHADILLKLANEP